jgi:hypothetical protein
LAGVSDLEQSPVRFQVVTPVDVVAGQVIRHEWLSAFNETIEFALAVSECFTWARTQDPNGHAWITRGEHDGCDLCRWTLAALTAFSRGELERLFATVPTPNHPLLAPIANLRS